MSDKKAKCKLYYNPLGWLEVTSPTGTKICVRSMGGQRGYSDKESELINKLVRTYHHDKVREVTLTYTDMTTLKTASEKKIPQQFVILEYYIPSAYQRETGFQPPYRLLHQIGLSFDGSCWRIPLAHVERIMPFVDDCNQRGCRAAILKFDICEQHKIQLMAREALEKRISELGQSMLASIAAAQAKFEEATAEGADPTRSERARNSRYRQVVKTAAEGLNSAVLAAELFDETMSVYDLFDGLRKAIAAQQKALNIQFE